LVAAAAEGAQHGKIDRIELANGDRLTVELVKLERGKLTVKTDASGTIEIEWNRVVSLTSPGNYEVELSSGERLFGSLTSPSPGTLQVGTESPQPLIEVVKLFTLEARFWRRVDGTIGLGFSYAQSNQRTEWAFDSTLSFKARRLVTQLAFDSLVATATDTEPENRQTLTAVSEWPVGLRWFIEGIAQFNRNEQLALDFRSTTGGALGRWITRSDRSESGVFAGTAFTREYYTGQPSENRVEVFTGLQWDWFSYQGREFDWRLSVISFFDLQDNSRTRVELDSSLKRKIVKDLHWSLKVFESFNSSPPEGERENDFGVTASLGWSF
jgi:hypothetical protein